MAMTGTSNTAILQKLIDLETSIQRMENKLNSIDDRVQTIERNDARAESVVLKVDDHESRLRSLEIWRRR